MDERLLRRADLDFILDNVLELEELLTAPDFTAWDRTSCGALLDLAAQIASDKFRNHYRKSDDEEPRLEDGRVILPPEIGEGLAAFYEAGFARAHHASDLGGMDLPWTVMQAAFAFFQAANIGTVAYPFLSIAAGNLIAAHGTEEQKTRYLEPLMSGRFFGTMALSEPQAGSSLAGITTKAHTLADGRYQITGRKMWTSGGEHDLADTIVHLVLARIEGAPEGVRGISLFIVPRDRVDEHGVVGETNDVQLMGLNHKMGYRATVNTALAFGEEGTCIGELVGAENAGLAQMFHMMNEARIGVGAGAVMLAYTGYLESLVYAKERVQGKALSGGADQVPIIDHADVKRLLLIQKSVAEGGLCLALYCAKLVDLKRIDGDGSHHLLLEILTPILKSWFSDAGLRANEAAIQVLGGYGYTRDFLVEQFYRDNRLNPIHEGTNGVQALDLLGRKVWMQGGDAFEVLGVEIRATCDAAYREFHQEARSLENAWSAVGDTVKSLSNGDETDRTAMLANATSFMEAMGRLVLGWIWLKQLSALTPGMDADFSDGKIACCRYVFRHEIPLIYPALELVRNHDRTTSEMKTDWF